MMEKLDISFEEQVIAATKALENNSEHWYRKPRGWLRKPDFKRAAQEKSNIENKVSFSSSLLSDDYQQRWFVLDLKACTLRYFRSDAANTPESGQIDMSTVLEIKPSRVFDAPEFSLDLITSTRHYTIVPHTNAAMVRWGVALNLTRNRKQPLSMRESLAFLTASPASMKLIRAGKDLGVKENSKDEVTQYSVTFEDEGPILINIMGSTKTNPQTGETKHCVVVTSFPTREDGSPGRAELTGKIRFRDYVAGVNHVNFANLSFKEATKAIHEASWPKTFHFERGADDVNRALTQIESWSFVHYGTFPCKRRRYVELRWDALNFKKPAPGGSAHANRDAYFCLYQIDHIRPVFDKTMPQNQQYILQLVCKPGSVVDYVGENDESIGGTPVEVLELCFSKHHTLSVWRSALIVPPTEGRDSSMGDAVQVLPMDTIEAVEMETDAKMGVKSTLTGVFAPRQLSITAGTLKWKRPPSVGRIKISKERSMFLANTSECAVRRVLAVQDAREARSGYHFQLIITTADQKVTLGTADDVLLYKWLAAIRDTVNAAPEAKRRDVVIATAIVNLADVESENRAHDEEERDYDDIGAAASGSGLIEGYLFKKGEIFVPGIGSEHYKRRWFILIDRKMYYWRSRSEADANDPTFALGSINLNGALEVREAMGKSAPEFCIEIVTPARVYVLVAENEELYLMWLEAVGDAIEFRTAFGEQATSASVRPMSTKLPRRVDDIMFAGWLSKKTGNRLTGIETWKDRFFVIMNGSLIYFYASHDVEDPEADCLGEIPCQCILLVESSRDLSCEKGCAFDVHAATAGPGAVRVYTLLAKSANLCKEWMGALCLFSNMELKPRKDGSGSMSVALPTELLALPPPPPPPSDASSGDYRGEGDVLAGSVSNDAVSTSPLPSEPTDSRAIESNDVTDRGTLLAFDNVRAHQAPQSALRMGANPLFGSRTVSTRVGVGAGVGVGGASAGVGTPGEIVAEKSKSPSAPGPERNTLFPSIDNFYDEDDDEDVGKF